MKTAGLAALSLCLFSTALAAQTAPAPIAPSLGVAVETLEAKGYTVLELDRDEDGLEIDALSSTGARVELLVDPATVEILRESSDD